MIHRENHLVPLYLCQVNDSVGRCKPPKRYPQKIRQVKDSVGGCEPPKRYPQRSQTSRALCLHSED